MKSSGTSFLGSQRLEFLRPYSLGSPLAGPLCFLCGKDDIWNSHRPALVEISRSSQQTAIQWDPETCERKKAITDLVSDIEFFSEAVQLEIDEIEKKTFQEHEMFDAIKFDDLQSILSPLRPRKFLEPIISTRLFGVVSLYSKLSSVSIAKIKGDKKDVTVVNSRITTVLSEGSEIAKMYDTINRVIIQSAQQKQEFSLALSLYLLMCFSGLLEMNRSDRKAHYRYGGDSANLSTLWRGLVEIINPLLSNFDVDEKFSLSTDFVTQQNYFDASDYWRDWHRKKKD